MLTTDPPPPDTVSRDRARRQESTAAIAARLAVADAGCDEELRMRLVELNMPIARMLAGHYAGRGLPHADLEQVAYLGLVAAARRFDPRRGDDFLSFAVPTVKGELRKTFRDLGWVVRPPRRLQELQVEAWSAEAEISQSAGRPPTPSEIASRLEVAVSDVVEALAIEGCFHPASLDKPLGTDTDTTYADTQAFTDPGFESAEARVMLAPLIRDLDERDRRILERRFVDGWTQREIGRELGVTQMQVSRLLNRILADLRAALERHAA